MSFHLVKITGRNGREIKLLKIQNCNNSQNKSIPLTLKGAFDLSIVVTKLWSMYCSVLLAKNPIPSPVMANMAMTHRAL